MFSSKISFILWGHKPVPGQRDALTEEKRGAGGGSHQNWVFSCVIFLWLCGGWIELSWEGGTGSLNSYSSSFPYQMDLKFTRALYSKGLSSLKKEGATLNLILTLNWWLCPVIWEWS